MKSSLKEELTILASTISSNTTAAISFNDPKAAEQSLSALHANRKIVRATIYLPDGKQFASYQSTFVDHISSDLSQKTSVLLSGVDFSSTEGYHIFENDYLETFMPIELDGETIGFIGIQAEITSTKQNFHNVILFCSLVMVLLALAAYFVSIRMSAKAISDPIIQLVKTMQRIAKEKDYSVRAQKQTEDETGVLIDGFNHMLQTIEKRNETLYFTQFSVDHAGVAVFWMDASGKLIYINA